MNAVYSLQFNDINYYVLALFLCVILFCSAVQIIKTRWNWKVLLLRLTVLGILICAFFDPHIIKKYFQNEGILLVDISDSMEPEVARSLMSQAKELSNEGFQVLPFAGEVSSYMLPSEDASDFASLKDSWEKLNIGETNLEKALRSQLIKTGTNVLLISDGFETTGSVEGALSELKTAGIKVFPLMPKSQEVSFGSFRITKLYAPLIAGSQKSVDVRVSIENSTGSKQSGKLTVFQEEDKIFDQEISVAEGQESVFIAASKPVSSGIQEFNAVLEGNSAPSSDKVFVATEEKEKVLLISGNAIEANVLKEILESQNYKLESIVTDGKRLEKLSPFDKYSVTIFNNVPLDDLPRGIATQVESYVANGGGFVMIGGNKSFGLGGYKDTAIADLLPVEVLIPKKEQKRLSVAVELVLDKSGSMSQDRRIEFVRSGAAAVLNVLKPDDYAGIIGFDEYPFHLVPIGQIKDIKEKAVSRLSQLYPAKSTRLLAVMAMAKKDIQGAKAGRKHMIILTDGALQDVQNAPYYMEMAEDMRLMGITVSTFIIGSDDVPILKAISEKGGGAFYRTQNPANLPKLFLEDVKVNAGEKTQHENRIFKVKNHKITSSNIKDGYPNLLGYVETKIKEKAVLELSVESDKSDPLLASWTYKAGRVLAYTSDISGRWSRNWVSWSKVHSFWTELVDSVRPNGGENLENIRFDLRYFVNHGDLLLDLTIYSDGIGGSVNADIDMPNGEKQKINFKQLARGHYQAKLANVTAGRYDAKVNVGKKGLTPVAFQVSGESFGEKKGQGFSKAKLEILAQATEGKINPALKDLMEGQTEITERYPINNWMCLLALIVLMLEIMTREGLRLFKVKRR